MRDDPRLSPSDLSPEVLRARAAEYAVMAATAPTRESVDALLKLAEWFRQLAMEREGVDPNQFETMSKTA